LQCSIVLFDGFTALDVVGGYEVLVNVPGVTVDFVAASRGPVAADTRRLGLLAYRNFDEVAATDILYVPGGPGVEAALADSRLLEKLRKLHESATWTLGVCNGVALLAAAGALDGRRVTTNWGWRGRLVEYDVEVVASRFQIDGNVVTTAGVSASIDGALALASLIAGTDVAEMIQLGIEYYPEPPLPRRRVEEAPESHREIVRQFEAMACDRLGDVAPPFSVSMTRAAIA
jgi:transcriptional regulator GlxA family with amidase domain